MSERGRFITLEGGEGGGKSTQATLLGDALKARGVKVLLTREPGGSPGAEEIRKLLVNGDTARWDGPTEALLHFAARRDHLVRTVWPALEAGTWVISDRFADSTMAYQGYGHGMTSEDLTRLYRITVGDFAPDLTFILDLPVEEGLARTIKRSEGEDRYERMDRAFHIRIRQAFLDIAQREPERCLVIPAGNHMDTVHEAIMKAVEERLLG